MFKKVNKKINLFVISLIIISLSLLTFMPSFRAEVTSLTGTGTKDDPFKITNEEELSFVEKAMRSKEMIAGILATNASYSLEQDLDMTDYNFNGLDNFTGELFDGKNHTITVNINKTGSAGFINNAYDASISDSAVSANFLEGMVIKDLTIKGSIKGTDNVGGLIGLAGAKKMAGTDSTPTYLYISLVNCVNLANVEGTNNVGGLVGAGSGNKLTNCLNQGKVIGGRFIAGIVGHPDGIKALRNYETENTYNMGTVHQNANIINPDNYVYFGSFFGYQARNVATTLLDMQKSGNQMIIHFEDTLPEVENISVFNYNKDVEVSRDEEKNNIIIKAHFQGDLGISEYENYGVYANYVGQVIRIFHNNSYVYIPLYDRTSSTFRSNINVNLNNLTHYKVDELANLKTVNNHNKEYVIVNTPSELEHLSWIINGNVCGENVAGKIYENTTDPVLGMRQIGKISIKLDSSAKNGEYDFDMTKSKGIYGTNNFYGFSWTPFSPYLGSFDGNNQKIKIEMNYDEAYMVGLFGTLSDGNIVNMQAGDSVNYVENLNVYGSFKGLQAVSSLIAEHDNYAPSLIDYVRKNSVYVTNVNNYAEVYGKYDTGAIIGLTNTGGKNCYVHLENVHNYGNITALSGGKNIGGIIGRAGIELKTVQKSASIAFNNVHNAGAVTGESSDYVGGLVGYLTNTAVLSGTNTNSKSIIGNNYVGGLFGYVGEVSGTGKAYLYNDSNTEQLVIKDNTTNEIKLTGNNIASSLLSIRRKITVDIKNNDLNIIEKYLNDNSYDLEIIGDETNPTSYNFYVTNESGLITISKVTIIDNKNRIWQTSSTTLPLTDGNKLPVAVSYSFILQINGDNFSITGSTPNKIDQDLKIITTSGEITIKGENLIFDQTKITSYGASLVDISINDFTLIDGVLMSLSSKDVSVTYQRFTAPNVDYKLEATYNGTEQMLEIIDTNGELVTMGISYRFYYQNQLVTGFTDAGRYDVEIEYYADDVTMAPITVTFVILPKTFEEVDGHIVMNEIDLVYDGKDKKPTFTITDQDGKIVLHTDYEISYQENIHAGQATAIIKFINNYQSTSDIHITYQILPRDLTNEDVNIELNQKEFIFDNKGKEPTTTITWQTLNIDKKEYELSYQDNLHAGNAQINISFKGDFIGQKSTTFVIKPFDLTSYIKCETLPLEATYDGNVKTLSFKIDYPYSGKTIIKYYLNNEEVTEIKNAGTYQIKYTIDDQDYIGEQSFTYQVNKASRKLKELTDRLVTIGYNELTISNTYYQEGLEYHLNSSSYQALLSNKITGLTDKTTYTLYLRYETNPNYEDSAEIIYQFTTLLSPKTVQKAIDNLPSTISADDFEDLKALQALYYELDERYYDQIDEAKLLKAIDDYNRLTIYLDNDLTIAENVGLKKLTTRTILSVAAVISILTLMTYGITKLIKKGKVM